MLVAEIHGSQINGTGLGGDKVMGHWREGHWATHITDFTLQDRLGFHIIQAVKGGSSSFKMLLTLRGDLHVNMCQYEFWPRFTLVPRCP